MSECICHEAASTHPDCELHGVGPMPPLIRGVVWEWGGGVERVIVDRDTENYIDGRVVIIPEQAFDALTRAFGVWQVRA